MSNLYYNLHIKRYGRFLTAEQDLDCTTKRMFQWVINRDTSTLFGTCQYNTGKVDETIKWLVRLQQRLPNSTKITSYLRVNLMTIWQPMETVPYNIPILVLLEKTKYHTENDCRIQHAFFHENIITIGDNFDFDKPKPIAWTYPPEIPDHLK